MPAFMERPILNSSYEYLSRHWELDIEGQPDPLHLVVEREGSRGEDAKVKTSTMETSWAPGVNRPGSSGGWAFAEFTEVHALQDDLEAEIAAQLDERCSRATTAPLRRRISSVRPEPADGRGSRTHLAMPNSCLAVERWNPSKWIPIDS